MDNVFDDDSISALTVTYRESLNDIISQKNINFIVRNFCSNYHFDSEYEEWSVLDGYFENYLATNKGDELFLTLIESEYDGREILFMLGADSNYPSLTLMLSVEQMLNFLAEVNYDLPENAKCISGHTGLVRFAEFKLHLKDQ